MNSVLIRHSVVTGVTALLFAFVLGNEGGAATKVPFPPLPSTVDRDLAPPRPSFFPKLEPWDLDPILYPFEATEKRTAAALVDSPKEAVTHFERARILFDMARAEKKEDARQNGYDNAARSFLQAYASAKTREIGYEALRLAARSFLLAEKYPEAEGVAGRIIERSGGDPSFYLLKGEAYLRLGNNLAAREALRRAQTGRWDEHTARLIAVRIADVSFLSGNPLFAESIYRKQLQVPSLRKSAPRSSLRFAETLLALGKNTEAEAIFREIRGASDDPEVKALARIGEGDAFLLQGGLARARFAYAQAEVDLAKSTSKFPRLWHRARKGDLQLSEGDFDNAARTFSLLTDVPEATVARDAGYKRVLALHLAGNPEKTIELSQSYLAKYARQPGDTAMRSMAARAAATIVRKTKEADPSKQWPAFSEYLFAFGRAPEGRELLRGIAKEWETNRLWRGAAALYEFADEETLAKEMRRVDEAERLYHQGRFDNALAVLALDAKGADPSWAAFRIASRVAFRKGTYDNAIRLARKAESRMPQLTPKDGKEGSKELSPDRELIVVSLALLGRSEEVARELTSVDLKAQSASLRSVAPPKPVDPKAAPGPKESNVFGNYSRVQERYRRTMETGGRP